MVATDYVHFLSMRLETDLNNRLTRLTENTNKSSHSDLEIFSDDQSKMFSARAGTLKR
jgi:hypothetical protein